MRGRLIVLTAALALLLAPAAGAAAPRHPVLFVHGVEGTGAQFESQALRLTSNGYPASWIDEVDYDSTRAAGDKSAVDAQIDAKIAELKKRTGASQVDVVAHSLGTIVMHDYLTDSSQGAERRKNVADYVNVDGQSDNPGVRTLALWAGIPLNGASSAQGNRHMDGAENVTIPNQTHVQTCTSWESFQAFFRFLTGENPAHDIVHQRGAIQVAGRALTFPQNVGLAGATISVWAVDATGHRTTAQPVATTQVTDGSQGGGGWGPLRLQADTPYEFAVTRNNALVVGHTYYEPFVRSDHTVRLLASDAVDAYDTQRPGSVTTVDIRYKELWGDQPGQTDDLKINGTTVCTASLCPQSKDVNAFFAFDRNRDGQTDLSTPDPVLGNLPFLSAGDVFIPSSPSATGTVTFQLRSRGAGPVRTVHTADWDSQSDVVLVQWHDFEPSDVQSANEPPPPAARSCQSRRSVTLHPRVSRRSRLLRATVLVDGRRTQARRVGARGLRISFSGRGRETVSVVVRVVVRAHGTRRTVVDRRSYHLCRRRAA